MTACPPGDAFGGQGPQRPDHVARRLTPIFRPLGHHRLNDFIQFARAVDPKFTQGRTAASVASRCGFFDHRSAGERRLTGEHVIQRCSQRINVASGIGRAGVASLFGSQVIERSPSRPLPASGSCADRLPLRPAPAPTPYRGSSRGPGCSTPGCSAACDVAMAQFPRHFGICPEPGGAPANRSPHASPGCIGHSRLHQRRQVGAFHKIRAPETVAPA